MECDHKAVAETGGKEQEQMQTLKPLNMKKIAVRLRHPNPSQSVNLITKIVKHLMIISHNW